MAPSPDWVQEGYYHQREQPGLPKWNELPGLRVVLWAGNFFDACVRELLQTDSRFTEAKLAPGTKDGARRDLSAITVNDWIAPEHACRDKGWYASLRGVTRVATTSSPQGEGSLHLGSLAAATWLSASPNFDVYIDCRGDANRPYAYQPKYGEHVQIQINRYLVKSFSSKGTVPKFSKELLDALPPILRLMRGKRVFVHCVHGQSRSAALILFLLCASEYSRDLIGMATDEVVQYLKKLRSLVLVSAFDDAHLDNVMDVERG